MSAVFPTADPIPAIQGYEGERVKAREWKLKAGWLVAGAFGAVAAINGAALIVQSNRPAPPPVIVFLDSTTGVITTITGVAGKRATMGALWDEQIVRTFVTLRERYKPYEVLSDFNTVRAMMSADVQKEYFDEYFGKDTDRTKTIGTSGEIDVQVHSVDFSEDGHAQVWFSTRERRGASPGVWVRKMATMRFGYYPDKLPAQVREVNAVGFMVLEYDWREQGSRP